MNWSDPHESLPTLGGIVAALTATWMLVLVYVIFPATGLSSPPLHIGILIACIFAVITFFCSLAAGLVAYFLEREYSWLFPGKEDNGRSHK